MLFLNELYYARPGFIYYDKNTVIFLNIITI